VNYNNIIINKNVGAKMNKTFKKFAVLIAALLLITSYAFASAQHNDANSYKEINNFILEMGKKYGPSHVLVAYDLDTTLLTSDVYIGSEAWFNWQSSLLGTKSKYLVSNNFDTMLQDSFIVMMFTKMHPTEAYIPSDLNNYQELGFKLMVLTARGANIRGITDANLKDNNMFNCFNEAKPANGFAGDYIPFNINNPQEYGLTKEELKYFNQGHNPRPVSFYNGIFSACGNNKGLMLQTLLKKADIKGIKCIVFVDNTQKNDNDVYDTFTKFYKDIDIETFTYGYSNPWLNKIMTDKQIQDRCKKEWDALKKAIDNING